MIGVIERARRLWKELRERRLVEILLVYAGAAWVMAQVVGFFVSNYELSRSILDIAVFLLILGFPTAAVVGWFHGTRGPQRPGRAEVMLLMVLLTAAVIGTYRIGTALDAPPSSRLAGVEALYDLGEHSVAVLPFRMDVTDPALSGFGRGLAELLETKLAQLEEEELRVVSGQRLFDLYRQETGDPGSEAPEEIPDALATRISRRAGARFMLSGRVLGRGSELHLNATLIELESGEVAAGATARGPDVFSLVDRVSGELASQILDEAVTTGELRPVSELATGDLDAFKAYQAGLEAERRFLWEDAAAHLERAVELDSTFASAHLHLALVRGNLGDPEAVLDHLGAAERHLSGASERERLRTGAELARVSGATGRAVQEYRELLRMYPDDKGARFRLAIILAAREEGRPEATRLLEEVLELDPYFAAAVNQLAYYHAYDGDFAAADSLSRRYVELEPDQPNPRDSRGEILEMAGRYEAARQAYRSALRTRPSFLASADHLTRAYLRQDRPADARRELDSLASSTEYGPLRFMSGLLTADSYLWEGRFDDALARLDRLEASVRPGVLPPGALLALGEHRASVYQLTEDVKRMAEFTVGAADLFPSLEPLFRFDLLSLRGDLEGMRSAREALERHASSDAGLRALTSTVLPQMDARIALAEGDPEGALRHLGSHERSPWGATVLATNYPTQRALLALRRGRELLMATREMDRMNGTSGRFDPLAYHTARYFRGRAHELLGNPRAARSAYGELVNRWGAESVRRVPLMADAPERLAALEGAPEA